MNRGMRFLGDCDGFSRFSYNVASGDSSSLHTKCVESSRSRIVRVLLVTFSCAHDSKGTVVIRVAQIYL